MTEQSITDYAWWNEALRRKAAGYGNRDLGPVSDGFPECGFYRLRRKGETPAAVAIFLVDGEQVANETRREGARRVDDVNAIWTWVAKDPVPYETYQAFVETGRWPDMDEAVAEQVENRGIGDNQPPDEAATLADQIESAKAGIEAYVKIGDDETLAKAQSLRARLNELAGLATKHHKAEKEPHLKAGRDVDAKWLPLAKDAKAAADTVRARMDAYETAKFKREQEERRKAEEARAAAERAVREAEAAGAPPTAPAPEPQPAPAPAQASTIKGGYGRAATVRVVRIARVVDWDAAIAAFRESEALRAIVQNLAQRSVDAGQPVPGVEVDEERRVA